jgi:acid phosphatase type 7
MMNMNHGWDRRRFLGAFGAAIAAGPMALGQDKPEKWKATANRPDTLFLTWQQDPCTTMTIQWIAAAGETEVRYRARSSSDWSYAPKAVVRPFPVVELPKPAPKAKPFYIPDEIEIAPYPKGPFVPTGPVDANVFRVELTGLTPGTEYEFTIGAGTAINRFRTMPAKATRTFSFISGGDCGVNAHAIANNTIAAAQDPMFALVAGDLGYDNGISGDTAIQFIRNYSTTMIDSQGRLIPMLVTIGNHEVRGSYGKTLKDATFFTPLFDGLFRENSYASLDFGDYLRLVLLDTGHAAPISGEQTQWLDETLAARSGAPHLIVANHVPAYPSYRSSEGKGDKFGTGEEQRKHWCPLFEKHQVDVVLEHHDHTFKRTKPLKGGRVDEATGIVYLGDGSWGKLRVAKRPEDRGYLDLTSTDYHITLHRLEGERRYHLALGETGKVLDLFHTEKKPRQRRVG